MSVILKTMGNFAEGYLIAYFALKIIVAKTEILRLICAGLIYAICQSANKFMTEIFSLCYMAITLGLMLLTAKERYSWREFIAVYAEGIIIIVIKLAIADCRYLAGWEILALPIVGFIIECTTSFRRNEYVLKADIIGKGGVIYPTKVYLDTGNTLYDGDTPICVVSQAMASKLSAKKIGEVAVSTVTGIKILPKVNLEFKVYFGDGVNKIYNAQAVVAGGRISHGCGIILHKDMF